MPGCKLAHTCQVIHMMISHRPIPSGPKDKITKLNLLTTPFSNQCNGLACTDIKASHMYETDRNTSGLQNKTHNRFCNNSNMECLLHCSLTLMMYHNEYLPTKCLNMCMKSLNSSCSIIESFLNKLKQFLNGWG